MSITNTNIVQQLQSIIDQLQADTEAVTVLDDTIRSREFLAERIMQSLIDVEDAAAECGAVPADADAYLVAFVDLLTLAYMVDGGLGLFASRTGAFSVLVSTLADSFRGFEDYGRRLWRIPCDILHDLAGQAANTVIDVLAEVES